MNVRELIEALEDFDPEAEVIMVSQPSWPLQHTLRGVTSSADVTESDDDLEDEVEERVYLVEAGHPDDSPYAPGIVFELVEP